MLCYCSLTTGESSMSTHQWRPAAYAAPPFVHRTNSGSGALPSGEPAAGSEGGNRERRPARTPTTTTCMSSAETNPIHDGVGENRRIRSPRRPQQTNTNPTAAAGVPMRAMPCHAMPCTPPRRPLSLSEQTVKMGCARRRRRTPGWNE
jgi:hypothetical protein